MLEKLGVLTDQEIRKMNEILQNEYNQQLRNLQKGSLIGISSSS